MRIVKRFRQLLNVSQQELATEAGISVRELARIEAGEQQPRRDNAAAIDRGFDAIIVKRLKKEPDEQQEKDHA